jgi:fibronectin type 3 domain-containing protein
MRKWKVFLILSLGLMLAGCGLFSELPTLPPDKPPASLQASCGVERDSVITSWSPVERASFYEIFRATAADGSYERLDTIEGTSFRDIVGSENQGKWYWYKVRACNAAGCGPESGPVRGYAGRPPAPENVRATQGDFSDKIRVSWDPVPGASDYLVFRDLVRNGTYPTVVAQSVEENFVYDSNVRAATWYWYKVRAHNGFGYSELSEAAGGYCGPRPIPFASDEEPN